jgi:hypothetical protein
VLNQEQERAWTVLDKVTIAYRGATYEIGRGADYFGIWAVAGPRSQPQEWWPETQEGWSDAWTRFTALEAPDAITPVGRNTTQSGAGPRFTPAIGARAGATAAALLIGVGVVLGIVGLFPDYLDGTSLAAQPDNLVAHVIYLAVWTASAALISLGGTRLRIGALLATGLSIVTFGLFLADAGTPIAGGAHLAGAGLVLSLFGWLACAVGSALAFVIRTDYRAAPATTSGPVPASGPATASGSAAGSRRLVSLRWPRGAALGPSVLLILAGLGAAAAFAPAWDSFTLRTAAGQTQTLTAGNAFSDPGPVIAGNVIVMVALAAVIIAAALWRPVRHGAFLLAGAIIPMVAQAISAIVQVGEATSPTQFGFTPAQASQLGLTISNGLTPAFWIYCVFVVILVVSCVWMLFTPHESAVLAGPGTEAGPGTDADPQVPMWHVARADAYDVTGVRSPAPEGRDRDIDNDTDGDTPADRAVPSGSQRDEGAEPGRRD